MSTPMLPPAGAGREVLLVEKFVSIQGEGPLTGQRCAFVRFAACNLTCSWCDTEYSWNTAKYPSAEYRSRVAVSELAAWVLEQQVDLMVVTGGEPMLQQAGLEELCAAVGRGVRVQVETNGTQPASTVLTELVDMFVVSPKLSNSDVALRQRIVPDALESLAATGKAVWKFVVSDPDLDFPQIEDLAAAHGLSPVWVMPEGATAAAVQAGLAAITQPAIDRGWNVSSRMHILTGAR